MLIIANVFISGYLIYSDLVGKTGICLTGQACKIVQTSQFSSILGINLSYIGFSSFIFLLIVYLLSFKNKTNYTIFLIFSIIGGLFALYLLTLQFLVIKAICSTCLAIDIFTLTIAILSILAKK